MKTLILSIGAGNRDDLEKSLFAPVLKSIGDGGFERVILVPSQTTLDRAVTIRDRVPGLHVDIVPLPKEEMENDADACFGHFDGVFLDLLTEGVPAREITVDFTRGTKAMSVAIAMAAVGRGVNILRYIEGERDNHGSVIPGTEVIRNVNPELARTRRDLDVSLRLLNHFQFQAVETMFRVDDPKWLDVLYPRGLQPEVLWIHWLARFWGAWDRFDYAAAVRILETQPPEPLPVAFRQFLPGPDRGAFLRRMAKPLPGAPGDRAAPARDLAADVLRNARRRYIAGAYEDAFVRAYRVLEMYGQIRLFTRGLDSENLDASAIQGWIDEELKAGRPVPVRRRRAQLPRGRVIGLLKYMKVAVHPLVAKRKSPLAAELEARNDSLLIHGYAAQTARRDARDLGKILTQLERVFVQEDAGNQSRLELASFPFPSV